MSARIFDHFAGGEPEDARFSRIARAMQRSPLWTSIPVRDEPAAVAGELVDHRDAATLARVREWLMQMDPKELDQLAEELAAAAARGRR